MGEEPDRGRQLATVPEREPLSEYEARRIGTAANRLPRLRNLLAEAKDQLGSVVVGGGYATKSIQVGSRDLQAVLRLLIEQDELFLASFNVKIERPA